ncbi:MAG: ATP-binding protein [Candidatus Binatia bacterium]
MPTAAQQSPGTAPHGMSATVRDHRTTIPGDCPAGHARNRATQSSDLYELVIERHRRSSTMLITSHRDVAEWIPLFDDPILAQSGLDRLAHNAHQIVIEGENFRKRQSPALSPETPALVRWSLPRAHAPAAPRPAGSR